MFRHDVSYYLGKPVKKLILESNYKLTYYGFRQICIPTHINGILLGFSNGITISIKIAIVESSDRPIKNAELWDINKCILEKVKEVKFLTDKPIRYEKRTVSVQYLSCENISIFYNDTTAKAPDN